MRNVTVYNFFKTFDGGADYINNGEVIHFSAEMFSCLLRQYRIAGYSIFYNNNTFVSVSKVEKE